MKYGEYKVGIDPSSRLRRSPAAISYNKEYHHVFKYTLYTWARVRQYNIAASQHIVYRRPLGPPESPH
jgi:hypothetical protein